MWILHQGQKSRLVFSSSSSPVLSRPVPGSSPAPSPLVSSAKPVPRAKGSGLAAAPVVSYISKDGSLMDLGKLRINLEILADDLDWLEACARLDGDLELAGALDEIFHDLEALMPEPGGATHE